MNYQTFCYHDGVLRCSNVKSHYRYGPDVVAIVRHGASEVVEAVKLKGGSHACVWRMR